MHNDEIKQALVTLVMAAYENGIVTRQEVRDFDPEYEAAVEQQGDWDHMPPPLASQSDSWRFVPTADRDERTPTTVIYDGVHYSLDAAVEQARRHGYVKPDYMTWEQAAEYLQDEGHNVTLDYAPLPEPVDDEDALEFPEDESTIIAIGYGGRHTHSYAQLAALYHPDCAVEEAISQGEASPAARGMSLADLYSQIGHNLLGEVMVHTTDTGLEWSKCDHCGEDFTTTQPEGGVIKFGPGEVTLDPETGVFERTTTTEEPKKKGFFERIFGA